ncbi:unnamed protein product [Mytilus coruscus]|uniref:Uncharacterized protein n=1 Tax=Mytilus coruscus TaxID=42192 RepID=A0A6J8BQJ8_MYTCO|nr:unnamed protein product [Mytilus coruscus]
MCNKKEDDKFYREEFLKSLTLVVAEAVEDDAGDDKISCCWFKELFASGDPSASEELTGKEWTADDWTADGRTGDEQTADGLTGDERTGDKRPGDERTGDERTEDEWTADDWTADGRTGDERTADGLTGDERTGDERTGDKRPGDERTGDERTEDERTGDERTGDERTGDERPAEELTGEVFLGCLNLTTHLLHHIPEGYNDFGPLYDRWLYPLERANSWITRQILQHGHEESTVMQTYRIYDWSVFNLLSGTVKQETTDRKTSLRRIVKKICNSEDDLLKTNIHSSKTMLPTNHIKIIQEKYCKIFSNKDIEMCDIIPVVESIQTTTRYDKTKRKDIFFATESLQISERSCDFIIHTRDPSKVFGKIKKMYRHSFRNNVYTWVLLDRFPLAEQCVHVGTAGSFSISRIMCTRGYCWIVFHYMNNVYTWVLLDRFPLAEQWTGTAGSFSISRTMCTRGYCWIVFH